MANLIRQGQAHLKTLKIIPLLSNARCIANNYGIAWKFWQIFWINSPT
ncbi:MULTISPECIES: hypothetical protein [Moorena]|nr:MULTISPECIES: hypothetical protein [Moorena]NEQ15635.1 hypothetical protein [Moorena sp. SIO3E2]NEP32710.1 hypothetical protein [Moorena sp. SIO3B2]NER85590.1 hypothetical protein [Moorena sp. SIO3A2]NES40984.1 hypothetical protein [Moorena sp. SIO2C4]NET64697.1 hypothetical protein [Moorena sp. SIO1G6]